MRRLGQRPVSYVTTAELGPSRRRMAARRIPQPAVPERIPGRDRHGHRPKAVSDVPARETLVETEQGNAILMSTVDGRVTVDWHGPRHAELTPGDARTLGYLLRGYAGMVEPGSRKRAIPPVTSTKPGLAAVVGPANKCRRACATERDRLARRCAARPCRIAGLRDRGRGWLPAWEVGVSAVQRPDASMRWVRGRRRPVRLWNRLGHADRRRICGGRDPRRSWSARVRR